MKRSWLFPIIVLFATIFLLTGIETVQGRSQVEVEVDGNAIESDVSAYIDENDRTMVPARFVSEALGAEVDWFSDDRRVEIIKNSTLVEVWINERIAKIDGDNALLDTFAVIENNRTMVPLRFLAESLGFTVAWNNNANAVVICSTPQPDATSASGKASIAGNNINVRTGPGTDFSAFTQLSEGPEMEVEAKYEDWYRLELPDGQAGWITEELLQLDEVIEDKDESDTEEEKIVDPEEEKGGEEEEQIDDEIKREIEEEAPSIPPIASDHAALVMKEIVNIRSSPTLDSSIISKIDRGQWLEIINESGDWYQVRLPNGQNGWIAGWLIAHRYEGEQRSADSSISQQGVLSTWGTGDEPGKTGDDKELLVTGIHVEQKQEEIVLTVTGNAPLDEPSSSVLSNPSRLAFDFHGKLDDTEEITSMDIKSMPVEKIRTSQFKEDRVRIVADLNEAASHEIQKEPGNNAIKITLKTTDKTVVIDPGHGRIGEWGGTDPGAVGPTGLSERDVVMNISRYLGEMLLEKGVNVIYTRKGDTALTLSERAEVANITGADILISIHANASSNPDVSGTMNFYYGSDNDQIEDREKLASLVHENMIELLERPDRGIRSENFSVLRNSKMPAVLVETAFITNPQEEQLLASSGFRKLAAEAITKGIEQYFAWKDN